VTWTPVGVGVGRVGVGVARLNETALSLAMVALSQVLISTFSTKVSTPPILLRSLFCGLIQLHICHENGFESPETALANFSEGRISYLGIKWQEHHVCVTAGDVLFIF
jgi:hypothetical protein